MNIDFASGGIYISKQNQTLFFSIAVAEFDIKNKLYKLQLD